MRAKTTARDVLKHGLAAASCPALLAGDLTHASGGPVCTHGIVYTQGLVLGPNNAPILAEFDSNGIASSIPALPNGGEATGELAEAQVMGRFFRVDSIFQFAIEIFSDPDRPEILAHIIISRSGSLGTEAASVGGEINSTLNVEDQRFGGYVSDGRYRSAQFLDEQSRSSGLLGETAG